MAADSCQFVGDSLVKDGEFTPCPEKPSMRLRLKTLDQMGWKPWVCEAHGQYLLSPKVQLRGRLWEICDNA